MQKTAQKTTLRHLLCASALMAGAFMLNGCGITLDDEPTKFTAERVQAVEKSYIQQMDTDLLTHQYLTDVATHYRQNGVDGIHLMLGYDPDSRENTSLRVAEQAGEIIAFLNSEGVSEITPSVLPMRNSGDKSQTIISYKYYEAGAPKNCDMMPGMKKGDSIDVDAEYQLGCTMEHVFAKQVARPKDLVGHDGGVTYNDGRRAANVVERYRTGIPNKSLGGESAINGQ